VCGTPTSAPASSPQRVASEGETALYKPT
jgi:hypothetical protein